MSRDLDIADQLAARNGLLPVQTVLIRVPATFLGLASSAISSSG